MHSLARIQAWSRRLSSAESLESIWSATLEEALRWFADTDTAWIWASPEPETLTTETRVTSIDAPVWQQIIERAGRPDTVQHLNIRPSRRTPLSVLIFPIAVGERAGWWVMARERSPFSEAEINEATYLYEMVRVAVHSVARYEQAEIARSRQAQELQHLRELAHQIERAENPADLVKRAVERTAELLNVAIAGILLRDESRQVLVALTPFLGIPDTWAEHYTIPLSAEPEAQARWGDQACWVIADAQTDPLVESLGLLPLAIAADAHQVLMTPLETAGTRIGYLQVGNPRAGRRLGEAEAHLLQVLAAQIAGLVHISQLMESLERRNQQLGSLVSVAATLGASLDLDTVLDEIVQAVSALLDCQRTVIFVLDPITGLLNLAAAQGVSEHYRRASQGIPVVSGGRAHAIAAKETVFSRDVQREDGPDEIAPMASQEGFRAYVDVPLLRGEEPVGLLSVQFIEPHDFSDDELNLLHILAEQAAVAIENARLYMQTDAELHRRLKALEALQRVTGEVTSTIELDHILRVVLDEALRFSEAEAAAVALLEDGRLVLRAVQGFAPEIADKLRAGFSASEPEGLLSRFLEQKQTAYIPDLSSQGDPADLLPEAGTVLLTPVFYSQRMAAVILLQHGQPNAFAPAVIEFMEGLAAQTAIAVGNAERYQEQLQRSELMHRRAEQMSLLLEVSRTVRSDRALEDVLLDVAYATREGTGFDIVLISVLEGDRLRRIAGAGIPLAELEKRKQVLLPWNRVKDLFQERFRIGRCYYIPEKHKDVRQGLDVFNPGNTTSQSGAGLWHNEDVFFVPLHSSTGDILGIMSVDRPQDGRAPTALTAEVVEIFASQVALTIENSQLIEDLRRQVTTLSLFNELNRSITTKLDLSLVLNTVVQAVTNMLGYDYATVYLQDQMGQYYVPLATSGYALELLEHRIFRLEDSLVGYAARTGLPLVIDDAEQDPRFAAWPIAIGSTALVPMTVNGRAVGVLSADRRSAGEFTPTEVATLTALADQVTVAIENARLFDEVKRFNEELEQRVAQRTQELAEALERLRLQRDRSQVLYHIASELVASLDMDRVLSQALSLLQKAVRASRSSVILLDNNTGRLFYRAAIGHTEPIPPGGKPTPFRRDQGIVGWVLTQRTPTIIPDAREDPRCNFPEEDMVRSVLAVPVLGGTGEALGVILLQSPLVGVFDANQLQLAEAAAVQLGNALNNAELYRLIREQAERLGTMLRNEQIEAAKNEAILEGIADGVMVADADGRVILFNAAAERILSITRSQAIGRLENDILGIYGTEAQAWLTRMESWKQSPEAYGAEEFLEYRLETERAIVSVHLSPVLSSAGEFLGVVSVFRDITAEIEADRAKSDFVSTVSHELRTPMTSIVGYVDLLIQGAVGPLTEMQLNFLSKVKSNADRLTRLVNDLLDISRIEQGRIELQFEPVSIEQLIEQVSDLLRPKIEEKKQSFYLEIPSGLPKVRGDSARLTQILTNLVGNAHKYTPVGGEFGVHAYVQNGAMHVAVVDSGIGIAPENQKKIFQRFFRVEDDPAVYEVSGTGLGLAITLSLIQMHGGSIDLESELGEGSIFTFMIPLAEGESEADIGEPPPGLVTSSQATILVVEDDSEIATLLRVTLEAEGFRVLSATSGEEALRVARAKLPDMISLDIRLPDLDGFEVLQLLRREPETADIPVVIVSVVAHEDQGLDLGAVAYLTKPLDEQRYLEIVRRVLDERNTVVLADSDKVLLNQLRTALQAQGLRVRSALRGERVLRLAREIQPALLVVSDRLPDVSSHEMLERLRHNKRTEHIPVMMITEDRDAGEVDLASRGVLGCLEKPFSIEQAVASIVHWLNGGG